MVLEQGNIERRGARGDTPSTDRRRRGLVGAVGEEDDHDGGVALVGRDHEGRDADSHGPIG